ncbi:MAG: L-lactate permease [Lactobacillaceae bacterium]|jgi:lactate permease|nr:L-lactate permease [Lactobacillaceae bacterium]
MLILVAALIIIVPLFLLTILNMPANKGMAISALIVVAASFLIWKMPADAIAASAIQGIHKTVTVLWILLGALVLLNVLGLSGAVVRITQGFKRLTLDVRLQAVIIAWLFGGLIEGVSGFGTPAIVTAPLLIALGFTPIAAVALALIGDSTAAIFGAVSTPINVGFSNLGLNGNMVRQIATTVTTNDLFAGLFIPSIIAAIVVLVFGRNKSVKQVLEVLPWTLLIGLVYTLSALGFAQVLGPDFVSILSPIVGIAFSILTIRFKILIPKNAWRGASHEDPKIAVSFTEEKTGLTLLQAWSPYIVVVILLFATRVVPIVQQITQSLDLGLHDILGFKGMSSDWQILYSPGTVLLVASLIALWTQKQPLNTFGRSTKIASQTIFGATGFTLVVTLIMVQVFSNSGINTADLTSMPTFIATAMAKSLAPAWLIVAPALGEIGALITGSSTVSALTFSPIQMSVATQAGLSVPLILGLQLIGGAAGNMIAIHNIVSVSAVVGLSGKEGQILRTTIAPALLYVVLAGLGALIISGFM